MHFRQASSPPDTAPSTPAPDALQSSPAPQSRKRKHVSLGAGVATNASSPAPSDVALPEALPIDNEVVEADVKASASRPRLTVSRLPIFIPVSEDSIYHSTDQVCMNRLGYRYSPAGLAAPGSKIPYRTIESRPEGYVRVSWEDRSPSMMVTTDGLGLRGDKGFRSARLNVPVREGKWYMEVKILKGGGEDADPGGQEGAHVRLGWGRREAQLNGPAGLDGYSYAYRDKTGDKVTLSRPRPYGKPFKTGDVVGMYISLPPKRKPKANDPYDPAHIRRERIAIDFKGQEYFECVEYSQSKEMLALMDENNKSKSTASVPSSSKKSATVKNLPERGRQNKSTPESAPTKPLPTLRDSKISFFVNGECQGTAFRDIYDYLQLRTVPSRRKGQSKRKRDGIRTHSENHFDDGLLGYYPFISLFGGAEVHLNPGPDLEFPPPSDIDSLMDNKDGTAGQPGPSTWRPLCERYSEFMHEQWALDAQEEEEAQGKPKLTDTSATEVPELPMEIEPPVKEAKVMLTVPKETKVHVAKEPKPVVVKEPKHVIERAPPVEVKAPPETHPSTNAKASSSSAARTSSSSKKAVAPPVFGPLSEADFKAAARRERKRIAEQKRRARKAEEARAAKAAKERAEAGIIDEPLPVPPVPASYAEGGVAGVYQSGVFNNVNALDGVHNSPTTSYDNNPNMQHNSSWQYHHAQLSAVSPPEQEETGREEEDEEMLQDSTPAFDPSLIDPALM